VRGEAAQARSTGAAPAATTALRARARVGEAPTDLAVDRSLRLDGFSAPTSRRRRRSSARSCSGSRSPTLSSRRRAGRLLGLMRPGDAQHLRPHRAGSDCRTARRSTRTSLPRAGGRLDDGAAHRRLPLAAFRRQSRASRAPRPGAPRWQWLMNRRSRRGDGFPFSRTGRVPATARSEDGIPPCGGRRDPAAVWWAIGYRGWFFFRNAHSRTAISSEMV
jgi:hypothetical protein